MCSPYQKLSYHAIRKIATVGLGEYKDDHALRIVYCINFCALYTKICATQAFKLSP
jgi:hypothetical protein